MGINTIVNIYSYDLIKDRSGYDQYLVLSFDNNFKDQIKNNISNTNQTILITFAEVNPDLVTDWNSYVTFFMKILKEVSTVIIDTKYYSEGFRLLQSCAINSDSVNEIQIWVDKDDTKNYRIIPETEVNSVLSKKERTYQK